MIENCFTYPKTVFDRIYPNRNNRDKFNINRRGFIGILISLGIISQTTIVSAAREELTIEVNVYDNNNSLLDTLSIVADESLGEQLRFKHMRFDHDMDLNGDELSVWQIGYSWQQDDDDEFVDSFNYTNIYQAYNLSGDDFWSIETDTNDENYMHANAGNNESGSIVSDVSDSPDYPTNDDPFYMDVEIGEPVSAQGSEKINTNIFWSYDPDGGEGFRLRIRRESKDLADGGESHDFQLYLDALHDNDSSASDTGDDIAGNGNIKFITFNYDINNPPEFGELPAEPDSAISTLVTQSPAERIGTIIMEREYQSILSATIVGSLVDNTFDNAWLGVGMFNALIVGGWALGFVSLGTLFACVFFSIIISIVLTKIDRRDKITIENNE